MAEKMVVIRKVAKKGSYANRHVTSDTKISLDVVDLYNRLLK